MTSNVYSEHQERFLTAQKSDFSFSSPARKDQNTTAPKTGVLKESRTVDYMRNRSELFTEDRKQNQVLSLKGSKTFTNDFLQELRNEHRLEVEKLLLEISRLHDLLDDQQKIHKYNIQKMKEESEHVAMMRISNLRQSQVSQLEMVDVQLKKTREALEQKTQEYEELAKRSTRKIENLSHEIETLRTDLKEAISNKNDELYKMKDTYEKESKDNIQKKEEQINEIKQLTDKQIGKIQKKLAEKEESIQDLKRDYDQSQTQKLSLELRINQERASLEEKITQVVKEQRQRQLQLVSNLKQYYSAENEQAEEELKILKETFLREIEQLLHIIRLKDTDSQRNLVFRETEKIQFKLLSENIERENVELRKQLNWLKKKQLQQIQLLKVKMGVLHENDISELVKVYELKVENLTRELQKNISENEQAQKDLTEEKRRHYQTKKKYDYTVARLNEEVMILRTGMSEMEKDMKEKVENQKSMMMLTSRSLIKEAELKTANVKFYEEELRKLRQLLEIQAQEVEDSERNVEEKIKMAEEQLTRLSNKILEIKGESEEAEKKFKRTIEEKEEEIIRLNKILNAPLEVRGELDENQEIKKLEELLAAKEDDNRTLKVKVDDLESQNREYRGDIERLTLESQMNSEEARKHYKALSDKNLSETKSFYERRIQELENDKKQLNRINSSQMEKITELIKKYKQAEDAMKELIRQAKKRGDLQNRIISLGMDTNLVKNMAELFHK